MSITRSLGAAASGISFQITNSVPDAQGSPVSLNPTLMKIEGYFISDVPMWLQLWDLNADPAGGTSSLYSTAAGGCRRVLYLGALQPNGFLWQYMDEPLFIPALANGLRACLSTTEKTYTAPNGTTEQFNTLNVEIEDFELENPSLTVVGDTTTNRNTLQLWATSSVHRIVRIEVLPNAAAYGMLFGESVVHTNDIPNVQLPGTLANGVWWVYQFGRNGIPIYSENTDGSINTYGQFALSGTTGLFDNGVTGKIRAYII